MKDRGKTMAGLEIPDKPDPQYWCERAKNTRAEAERMANPTTKRMLLAVSESYERLANTLPHARTGLLIRRLDGVKRQGA